MGKDAEFQFFFYGFFPGTGNSFVTEVQRRNSGGGTMRITEAEEAEHGGCGKREGIKYEMRRR